MANIHFGVNLIPKADNTYTIGNSDYKWQVYVNSINGKSASDALLPTVSSTDNGKVLQVSSGAWTASTLTIPTKVSDLQNDSGFVTTDTTYSTFVQSGSSAAGGLVPAPSSTAGTTAFLCEDGTWKIPTDTTYSTFVGSGSSAAAGLVPAPGSTAGTSKFLCEDGTWAVPTDTTYSVMTGATSSTAGTSGLVPAPTTGDVDKFLAGDGTYKSGGLPMVILSYGNSTWADFEAAYKNNVIVYCRASSNSNPATGTQGRMAFMAYTNDGTNPTEVEFQYYRSVATHKSTQMGDEVYVYKLNKTSGWSVTKRLASIQSITGTGITVGYTANTNVITLTNGVTVSDSLTDTSTTAALSAAKGKALNDAITSIHERTWVEISVSGKTREQQFVVEFPSGYSFSNCFLGNISYFYGGSSAWYGAYAMNDDNDLKIGIGLNSNGIAVIPIGQYSNYSGSKLMVELVKN